MSAHRLTLASFIRHGPRFPSLTQHPAQSQNEPHNDDDVPSNPNIRVAEAVLPLPIVNLVRTAPQLEFSPHLAGNHYVPSIHLDFGDAARRGRLLPSYGDRVVYVTFPQNKAKTAEASVQTDLSVEGPTNLERVDQQKYELDNAIGLDYMSNGLHAEAIKRFHCAAANGNVEAMNNLADCLFNGIGVTVNKKEAWYMWSQAAHLGHAESMYSLAICHLRGEGTNKDITAGLHWMRNAANAGNAEASFYMVVRLFREGKPEEARRLVRTACRDEEYDHEMRSWVLDDCLTEQNSAVLKEELDMQ